MSNDRFQSSNFEGEVDESFCDGRFSVCRAVHDRMLIDGGDRVVALARSDRAATLVAELGASVVRSQPLQQPKFNLDDRAAQ